MYVRVYMQACCWVCQLVGDHHFNAIFGACLNLGGRYKDKECEAGFALTQNLFCQAKPPLQSLPAAPSYLLVRMS